MAGAKSALGRENHRRRGGVGIKLARAILQVAFRGGDGAAAMHDAAFRAHRPGVLGQRTHQIELEWRYSGGPSNTARPFSTSIRWKPSTSLIGGLGSVPSTIALRKPSPS